MRALPAKKGPVTGQKCRDQPTVSAQEDLTNREAELLDIERLLDKLIARAPDEVAEAGFARWLRRANGLKEEWRTRSSINLLSS